ncbi:MAG: apolipoprotein N-acyltransferase [Candidatus Omnitrophica bacterium]|nr:apolipoprotein N-acyltransferase [Candidatus Omnitrophota bacterium]MDD5574186.1 apolipoprotein N-acyltransferase [Candidatus Omnitrophota bacterium]
MRSKMLPWVLALFSVVLLRLSFPRPGLWMLAWVALVPFFFSLERKDTAETVFISFCAGLVYDVALLFWLIHVTVAGMLVLAAYLALYFVLFGLGWSYGRKYLSAGLRLIFVPSVWIVLEYVRSHLFSGFPWGLLSQTQTPNIPGLQGVDLFGSWGLSFILVFANVFVFELLSSRGVSGREKARRSFIPAGIIAAWFLYGLLRMYLPAAAACPLKVAVIQGNIPQEIKWAERFREGIFRKHVLLSELAVLKEEPGLVVWPETAFTDYLEIGENDRSLSSFAAELGVPLLVGSIRFQDMRYYNSALLYGASGKLEEVYDKVHLVPFGEYIPVRRYLPFLESIVPIEDFTPGGDYRLFSIPASACPGLRFGVLICFEDIFPELAREFVARGADFLINMTNDGWFGDTSSPYQHAQASVLRAVENRVYVVRAANTGVSCIIDDTGRIKAEVKDAFGKKTFVRGEAAGHVGRTLRRGLYTRIGDVLILIVSFAIFGMIMRRKSMSARFTEREA